MDTNPRAIDAQNDNMPSSDSDSTEVTANQADQPTGSQEHINMSNEEFSESQSEHETQDAMLQGPIEDHDDNNSCVTQLKNGNNSEVNNLPPANDLALLNTLSPSNCVARPNTQSNRFTRATASDYESDIFSFTVLDFLFTFIAVCILMADIGTDLWVAVVHYKNGDFWWFGLTLAFVFVPCFAMAVRLILAAMTSTSGIAKSVPGLIPGGMIYYYIVNMYKGVQSLRENEPKKKQELLEGLISEVGFSAVVRLIEAFMEAAPELVLQLYIMFSSPGSPDHHIVAVQWVAVATSLASLSWAVAFAYKCFRLQIYKQRVSRWGLAFMFLWRLFTVGARVFSLALFATYSAYGIFILSAVHYMVMLTWLLREGSTDICKLGCDSLSRSLLMAFVYIFCFWNPLRLGNRRFSYIVYYVLVYIENVGMLLTWYFATKTAPLWLQYMSCVLIMGGFFIGIFFMAVYDVEFHPDKIKRDHNRVIASPNNKLKGETTHV